jgi:membrane protease YdiL (CAAX protease family)
LLPPPGAHPGWRPPAGTVPPHLSEQAAATAAGRLLSGKALLLTALAIGVGAVGMGLSWLISRNTSLEPEVLIRYAIVITVSVYVVVATLLVTQLTPAVRLRWSFGSPLTSAALGLGCGVTFSLLLLGGVSAASGHLSPDPRIVLMMSEGDLPHVLAVVLISCIAAPLIEETLFRGVLLESLRPKGPGLAILISALAFSAWHLTPSALRYYALMGAALGFLYSRRGLVCSMAAHFGFNGVLTVAAIIVVLSPGSSVVEGNLTLHTPRGWHKVHTKEVTPFVELRGPSASNVEILGLPTPTAPSLDTLEERLAGGSLSTYDPDIVVNNASIRTIRLGNLDAVAADMTVNGHFGTMVFAPQDGTTYELVFESAGSAKAKSDFEKMLASADIG